MTKEKRGFTIIELMIATTIFSLVLMLCLAGIMQITKMYYRGVTQARTREVARSIVDEIGEAIRFSNQEITLGPPVMGPLIDEANTEGAIGFFCIGSKRYTYAIDRQVKSDPEENSKQQRHALWLDESDICSPVDLTQEQPSTNGKSLLQQNMRLYELSIEEVDPRQQIYTIRIGVAYGDDDLLSEQTSDRTQLTCEGAFVGTEFCATTNFLVSVQKRL